MPIKIVKRGGKAVQPAAPLQEGALAPEAVPEPVEGRPAEEVREHWKDIPGPKTKAKQCAFCKHWYIKPCKKGEHEKCANWLHLQSRAGAA
jgi:hypothetical protein